MEFQSTKWRLINTEAASGSWNMAVDEAILRAVGSGEVLPTLRLYSWTLACISLGYAQPASDIDMHKLDKKGWEIVRRITGGRAILHTDELTYSVCGPEDEPRLAGGILPSYQNLSRAILQALISLDLPVTAASQKDTEDNGIKNPICFEVKSNYEISVDGKKMVGSAQARRKEGVLQHGTLPLYGDLTRIIEVLTKIDHEQKPISRERMLQKAATVEMVLGRQITWEQAADAMKLGFEQELNIEFIEEELTENEIRGAELLAEEKYGTIDWTQKEVLE
jgi:lipoate-protein ligase A